MQIFDTHAHLNDVKFKDDVDDVVFRAKDNGISKIIVPGTDIHDSEAAVELAKRFPGIVYAAVGVHPHEADNFTKNKLDALNRFLSSDDNSHVVAIGEIGMDFYRNYSSRESQYRTFRAQIELAIEHNLPIIVHVRDAFDEVFDALRDYSGDVKGVFHCFSGGVDEAVEALKLGFWISFAGNITFKKAGKTLDVVRAVPDDKLLVETDAPYLTPVPFRGKRNEPSFVVYTLTKVAELKGADVETMAQITYSNAVEVFKIHDGGA